MVMDAKQVPISVGVIVAVAIVAACSGGESIKPAAQETRRDSAGVAIVQVEGDPWRAPVWAEVDTVNVLRIGATDSLSATFFGYLFWADVLSDGSIVTLDTQSGEVNVYSTSGAFVRRIGRTGQGPGEFEHPIMVKTGPGDSIHVVSPEQRIDVFSREGKYGRSVPLSNHEPLRALADGSYLVSRQDEHEFTEPKVYEIANHATIYRLTPDGDTTGELARYQSYERTYRPRGRSHEMALQLFKPVRYAHGTSFGFVWCDAEKFYCDEWNDAGRKVRSIRINAPLVRVIDADVNSLRAARLEKLTTPQARANLERQLGEADRAATFPLFSAYRVDDADRLWFRQFTQREDTVPNRWIVISAEGELLGSVTLPAVYRVMKIAAGFIVAMERGSNDEQVLAVFKYAPLK